MKTIKFISAIALTLGMVACDSYDLPNPPGQNYPNPDGYFENSGLVLATLQGDAANIDLKADNAANVFTKVAEIQELVNFPEGYNLVIDMEVSGQTDFSKKATIETVIDGNDVTVNPDILNGAIQAALTKQPGTYDVAARFVAYAELGNTRCRLGGLDAAYGDELLKIETLDPAEVIEDLYYLVPCDAAGTPDLSKAMAMNNTSGAGVSPYDNPEFALKFDVPVGVPYRFMIAPQSAITAGDASALIGGNAAEGGFSGRLGDYPAALVPIEGSVFITINMETKAYTLSYAFENLYPFTGSLRAEQLMLLYTDNYINYKGVCAINKQVIFSSTTSKTDGIIFRQSPDEEQVISDNGYEFTGALVNDATARQVRLTFNGLYFCDVNLVQMTYKIDAIQSLAVIGNGNGWSHDTSFVLTPVKKSGADGFKVWTASGVVIDGDFKLATNGDWDGADFGGVSAGTDSAGNLVYTLKEHGSNMSAPAGTYSVTVDFSTYPYTLTLK